MLSTANICYTSCVFQWESAVFPERILISFGFADLPRAPAPLCEHGLRFFTRVNETITH